jgi:hypothetical protein
MTEKIKFGCYDDWPADATVGPKFLAELRRRHPRNMKMGSLDEAKFFEFFDDVTSQLARENEKEEGEGVGPR